MTLTLPPLVAKELRALLPVWGACAAALVLATVPGDPKLYVMAPLAYATGAIALGALSIGHEYTGGTLGLLLSQPIDRRKVLLAKSAAVGLLLLALAAVAWVGIFTGRAFHPGPVPLDGVASHAAALLVLPALAGLCIAPLLTMVCRSPIAGVVFTATVLGAIWGAAQRFVLFEHAHLRSAGSSLAVLQLPPVWYGTIGLSALAAFAGWRTFLRLEAIDGRGEDMHLPRWSGATTQPAAAAAAATRRHPFWHLALKELHLQQMTFVVAALYLLCWVGIAAVRPQMPEDVARQMDALTFLYAPLIALLAGSLASAEERQFGTLEWQAVLPLAAWRQWAVKVGTAIGLAFLLGLGLPALLETIRPSGIEMQGAVQSVAALLLVLASIGIYVSSLSTTGVRALLLSLPVTMLVILAARIPYSRPGYRLMTRLAPSVDALPFDPAATHQFFVRNWQAFWGWEPLFLAAIFGILVVGSALVNHRSVERGLRRVWKQTLVTGAAVYLAMFLVFCYGTMSFTVMSREHSARKAAERAAPAPAAPANESAPGPPGLPPPGTTKPAPRQ